MKKFEISLMVIVILMLSLVGTVSAARTVLEDEVVGVSDYLKADFNSDYGVIKISNYFLWVETEKLAEYSLT
jgi:hypothetical protein